MRPSSLLLLLLLGVDEVCSGRVKNAIFGSMFSGSSDSDINIHTDADQVELIEFLAGTLNGGKLKILGNSLVAKGKAVGAYLFPAMLKARTAEEVSRHVRMSLGGL